MTLATPAIDNRSDGYNPIARGGKTTVDHSGTSTDTSANYNGEAIQIMYEAPELTTDVVFVLNILDEDDIVLFTQADIPHNMKGKIQVDAQTERFGFSGRVKFQVVTANSQTDKVFEFMPILR